MRRRLTFAWSADARGRSFASVTGADDLDVVLGVVHDVARAVGVPLQVDIWPGTWTGNGTPPEPYVQAVIGHPERGALLWTEDGEVEVGVEAGLDPYPAPIVYERGSRQEELDGEWTRLRPATLRQVLADYVVNERRPPLIGWVDLFDEREESPGPRAWTA